MAKKRIAADVDLCGNSVENVKNVTASGTVKAGTLEGALKGKMLASSAGKTDGKVATLPNYTYKNLFGEGKYVGATGGPTYPEFYKKWLQQLVADNLLTNRTTYSCQAEPNGIVAIMLSVTDVTPLSSDGLPRICCATAINYTGDRTMFGVNSGTYYCYTSAYYGNGTATRAVLDGNGANIANTYATKTTTNGLQSQISSMVAKTQKLSSDGSTYSGKAVNDGEGNNISETYAKKAELPTASDGFYSAPKLITASSDNATGDMILSIDHPCKGTSGVEFVLMTKTKRMRCGYKETSSDTKTKDTKRGWTVAQNFRRGKMSYGENNPLPCVLDNVLDNYNTILQYVKKYYMYPFNTAITAVKTTDIPTKSLYFGGWNMTTNQKTAKVFGIAARRLKSDGKYEYSQPAAILITKTATKGLRIGVL